MQYYSIGLRDSPGVTFLSPILVHPTFTPAFLLQPGSDSRVLYFWQ